jgi:hypothetical protein
MKTTAEKKSQVEKFKEAARDLGTDDSEEAFDAKLKKIATAPASAEKENPPKR